MITNKDTGFGLHFVGKPKTTFSRSAGAMTNWISQIVESQNPSPEAPIYVSPLRGFIETSSDHPLQTVTHEVQPFSFAVPVCTKKPEIMQSLPIPSPAHSGRFSPQNSPTEPLFGGIQAGDLAAANAARAAKLTEWAKLDLRQGFADEAFMRSHIKAAGLRAPNNMEPATTSRLRSLLRRADIHASEITEALATTLSGYLMLNPSLPLWAALALLLEATGRFSDLASVESSGNHH